jgi:hypothetical protein
MSNSEEYDVVIATLQEAKDKLWKMTQSNMNMDMFNLMDQIRLEQIQELNEAMGMWLLWKEEKGAVASRSCKEAQG